MGRKLELEKSEIHTVANTYDVVLRIAPDTGMVHSGLSGKHVEGCTREEVFARLQQIADERDEIRYVQYLVLDPAVDPLVIKTYRIGTYECCFGEEIPIGNPDFLQWGLMMPTLVPGRITARRVPQRWIIRPDTRAMHRDLERTITRLHTARRRLRDAEQNFDALTGQNPSWVLLGANKET